MEAVTWGSGRYGREVWEVEILRSVWVRSVALGGRGGYMFRPAGCGGNVI